MAYWKESITVEVRYPIIDHCTLRYIWSNPITIGTGGQSYRFTGDNDCLRWIANVDYARSDEFTICGKAVHKCVERDGQWQHTDHPTTYKLMACESRRVRPWETDPKFDDVEQLQVRVVSYK